MTASPRWGCIPKQTWLQNISIWVVSGHPLDLSDDTFIGVVFGYTTNSKRWIQCNYNVREYYWGGLLFGSLVRLKNGCWLAYSIELNRPLLLGWVPDCSPSIQRWASLPDSLYNLQQKRRFQPQRLFHFILWHLITNTNNTKSYYVTRHLHHVHWTIHSLLLHRLQNLHQKGLWVGNLWRCIRDGIKIHGIVWLHIWWRSCHRFRVLSAMSAGWEEMGQG